MSAYPKRVRPKPVDYFRPDENLATLRYSSVNDATAMARVRER